jgi:hypothetical protein
LVRFALLLCLIAPFLSGCSGGYYLMQYLEKQENGEWVSLGDGCFFVEPGGSVLSGGLAPDPNNGADEFGIETVATKGKATVTLTTASEEKVLEFDRAFLASGDEVVTSVTTDAGTEYRVTHWGDRECQVSGEDESGGASPGPSSP